MVWKCLNCGKNLIRLDEGDEIADFKCQNDWCNSFYTLNFLMKNIK